VFREELGSNAGRGTGYTDSGLCGIFQSLQANYETLSPLGHDPLLSKSLPIHYSLVGTI
jgi:hypothetical protein